MTLVAGVDSSTQSCKVVVCEAATGAVVRSGTAPHPDGTEVDPAFWLAALRKAVDGAGGLGDVACPRRRRATTRDGLSGLPRCCRPTGVAVERHPVRRGGRRTRRRARRPGRRGTGVGRGCRQRPGPVVHRDQVAMARRTRTGERRKNCLGVPPARLAHLATRRRPGRPRAWRERPRNGPRRRERHRLLLPSDRRVSPRSPRARLRAGDRSPRGPQPRRACRAHARGPGIGVRNRRQRRRRARRSGVSRRRRRVDRDLGHGIRCLRPPCDRPVWSDRRLCRRDRPLPPPRVHTQRRAACSRRWHDCSGSTSTSSLRSRFGRQPVPMASSSSHTSRESGRQTDRSRQAQSTASASIHRPPHISPAPRSRACCAASPLDSTPCSPMTCAPSASSSSVAPADPKPFGGSPPESWDGPSLCPRRENTWRLARRDKRHGRSLAIPFRLGGPPGRARHIKQSRSTSSELVTPRSRS